MSATFKLAIATANSVNMSVALDGLGIYNKMVIYPGHGHAGYQKILYDGEQITDLLDLDVYVWLR